MAGKPNVIVYSLMKAGLWDNMAILPTDPNANFWHTIYNAALSATARNYLPCTTYRELEDSSEITHLSCTRAALKGALYSRNTLLLLHQNSKGDLKENLPPCPSFLLLFQTMDKTELLNPINAALFIIDFVKYLLFGLVDIGSRQSDTEGYRKDHYIRRGIKIGIEVIFSLLTLPLRLANLLLMEPANYSADVIGHWNMASGTQKALAVAGLIWSVLVATAMACTVVGIKTHTIPIVAKLAHVVSATAGQFFSHIFHSAAAKMTLCCQKTLLWTGVMSFARTATSVVSSSLYAVASCFGFGGNATVHPAGTSSKATNKLPSSRSRSGSSSSHVSGYTASSTVAGSPTPLQRHSRFATGGASQHSLSSSATQLAFNAPGT